MIVLAKSPIRLNAKFLIIIIFAVGGLLLADSLYSVWGYLVIFGILSLILVYTYNDRQFTSPVSVFSLFYYPYSTWFAYYLMFGTDFYNESSLIDSLRLSYIGLIGFYVAGILVSSLVAGERGFIEKVEPRTASRNSFRIVMGVSAALLALAAATGLDSGAANKRDILNAGGIMLSAAGFGAFVLATGMMLGVLTKAEGSGIRSALFDWLTWGCMFLLLLAYLVLGERDFIFRGLFGLACIYFICRRTASVFVLLCMLLALVFILPVTQALKGALLPGAAIHMDGVSDSIFQGELISASRNLYMLVDFGFDNAPEFLWGDVARGLTPFGDAIGLQSSTSWYNSVFRVNNDFAGTSGWGFTLVGEGYLAAGVTGVLVVMGGMSAILHYIYLKRGRSQYWTVFYILCLSGAIYCIRADVANLMSQMFKVGGLSVVAFWALNAVMTPSRKRRHINAG